MNNIINSDSQKQELARAHMELSILYEISNAMRTTLKLDEILYIILTGVTAHAGLGFNRAMLFLLNEKERLLEGRLGIGPDTGEEADRIWKQIEAEKMNLDDLISAHKSSDKMLDSQFNHFVTQLKFPLNEKEGGILSLAAQDGMPLHITKEAMLKYQNDPILRLLHSDELAIVPSKAKNKVNGIIVADNIFTHKTITKDDIRMFMLLADQAGLAIENSLAFEQTLTLSQTDSLTNLWNHGYFQAILQEELEKAKVANHPLSLLMIDIDFFKKYNDTFGHQKGDKALTELSRLLKYHSRKMDYVCRYGGEEFSIILPQTAKKEAHFIAERIRETIASHPLFPENLQIDHHLSVSIGVATFPEDAPTKSDLISLADKLMYEAKNLGRNTSLVLGLDNL